VAAKGNFNFLSVTEPNAAIGGFLCLFYATKR